MNQKVQEIVFVTLEYYPLIGGAEKQAQAVAEGLVNRGYMVSVLTRWHSGLKKQELVNNVKVVRIRTVWIPVLSWLSFTMGVLKFVREKRHDNLVLQAQIMSAPAIAAAIAGAVFKKPTLVKLASGGCGGNVDTLLKSHLGKLKLNFLRNHIDYFVAINKEIQKELLEHGVINRKIKLIPNGVDTDIYTPPNASDKLRLKRALNLTAKKTILFIGRLDKVKNIDILIESFAEVVKFIPDVSLVIVGSGPEDNNFKKLVQHKNLTEKVIFKAETQNVLSYFKASDIFILPSSREGISNALLEAMACGLTPVVSNVGGNKDLVIDRENGLVVEPGEVGAITEALKLLLEDTEWRLKLAEKAKQTVRINYELKNIIQLYLNLYEIMTKKNYKKHFPILTYHRIQKDPEYGMDVSTSSFEKQMEWLYKHNWKTISLGNFISCIKDNLIFPSKSFIITFDDGHRDNYEQAFPILKKYGFTAIIFPISSHIGKIIWAVMGEDKRREWYDTKPDVWDDDNTVKYRKFEFLHEHEIKEMSQYGIEFGAHTLTHPFLTNLSEEEQIREIHQAKNILEKLINKNVDFFCYPYADFDQKTMDIVIKSGYKGACFSPSHYDLLGFYGDLFKLERISVFGDFSLLKFKLLVTGKYNVFRKFLPSYLWQLITRLQQKVYG